jgi:hypothetical protein
MKKDKDFFIIKLAKDEVAETLKVMKQTGKLPDLKRDEARKAKLPGKRVSKTGKIYWETRKNRSDKPLKEV